MSASSQFVRRTLITGTVGVALAVLAGCGGGGGSDPPRVRIPTGTRSATASAGADLTAVNAQTVSAPLVRALSGTGADSFVPLGADGREQAAAGRRAGGALSVHQLDRLVRHALGRAVLRERIAQSETLFCPGGGSMVVSAFDNDSNGDLGPGDSISINAFSCVIEAGLPPASGGFSMTVNAIEGRGENITALDVSAQFDNFGVQGYGSIHGSFRMWSRLSGSESTVRLSYLGTVNTELVGGNTTTVIYDFDTFSQTINGTPSTQVSGGIGIGGQTYVIETVSPLTGGPTPTAGVVRLKDAQGDFAQISALNDGLRFNLDFYLAANPTVPALSLPGQLWSDYEL